MAIFGSLAFISGTFVMLFLPETLGIALPETVAEAANQQINAQDINETDEHDPLIWILSVIKLQKLYLSHLKKVVTVLL